MDNNTYKNENRFESVINEVFLKQQNNQKNLVLDTNIEDGKTLEEVLLGLTDIKNIAENELGAFDNIDIRLH